VVSEELALSIFRVDATLSLDFVVSVLVLPFLIDGENVLII
jgi:hypothetical protein